MTMPDRLSTGIAGLDEVLCGGLVPQRSYLVRGGPGWGKTTVGLHFLTANGGADETLFIGFQESDEQLRANAAAVGLDVSNVNFLSLVPDAQFFAEQQGYDVFAAADVEQQPIVEAVVREVEAKSPARVFVDSLTQLRFLSADVFQYRKQVLSFLRFLQQRGATVLFSSEHSRELPDDDLQFMADGVFNLEGDHKGGALRVSKFRGSDFRRGEHQMRVTHGGVSVFPRPMPPATRESGGSRRLWKSGVTRIDDMLSGGFESGTISLITGPAGIGKSTLAALFVNEAARQQRRSAVYLFEEEMETYLARTAALGMNLREARGDGRVLIEQVEPMRYLADEFAMQVRRQVEEDGVELVVIDSTAGFELTLDGEDIRERMHAMSKSLARLGVSVILVNEVETLMGEFKVSEKGISYLSDNVVFLRYIEVDGELYKAIGVLKKRLSDFERRMRHFHIGKPAGINVDENIEGLAGVLSNGPVLQEAE